MRLDFVLLVVDDVPEGVDQATKTLQDYLHTKGLALDKRVAKDLSERGLRELARSSGKDLDLVMVDYHLGQFGGEGASAAKRLRNELPYTEMLFYSSDKEADLLGSLAAQVVPGVFVARRENLDEALKGLADTVIGKVVDINHMRGLAMAEVAEMDVLMEETLAGVFGSADDGVVAAGTRTVEQLRERLQRDARRVEKLHQEEGLTAVVRLRRIFSAMWKYQAITRVGRCLQDGASDALTVLGSYDTEILGNRNILAHAKEEMTDDGKVVLRSIKHDGGIVTIDDVWMIAFRRHLRRHREALVTLCTTIRRRFSTPEDPENS